MYGVQTYLYTYMITISFTNDVLVKLEDLLRSFNVMVAMPIKTIWKILNN